MSRHTFGAAALLAALLACARLPPPGAVFVESQPPPEMVEVVPLAHGAGYVWVRGYWRWDRLDFHWIPGLWVMPEKGYRSWVPGRWAHSDRGWYWVDGHWQ